MIEASMLRALAICRSSSRCCFPPSEGIGSWLGGAADGSVATPSRMRPCSGMFRPSAILV